MDQYLFDSHGNWIAFRVGQHVFDPSCAWIGWLPWDDSDVATPAGEYLGTIYPDDRFLRRRSQPRRVRPVRPVRPIRPIRPVRPVRPVRSILPVGAEDIPGLARS